MSATLEKSLLAAVNAQTENINSLMRGITTMATTVGELGKEVSGIKVIIDTLTEDVNELKNEEEIKTSKAKELRKLANKVVSRRLGINEDPAKRSIEEKVINEKYRSMFSAALYTEVSEKGHLASPYSATAKKDFIAACKDIEDWYPREGVEGLKKRADENAVARKIAKEQGY